MELKLLIQLIILYLKTSFYPLEESHSAYNVLLMYSCLNRESRGFFRKSSV
ncbi:MAG: hypothetical protein ACJASQ_003050 [Crocinitomicaceae bacterium]|jgi:hypothetical protein